MVLNTPRELMLLRHAKSSWTKSCDDFDRNITEKGKSAAEQIGLWLKSHQLPDYIICSPARRTRETAEIVCHQLGISTANIRLEPQLYEADLADILSIIASCPPNSRHVLLVGHNPSIETLTHHLVTKQITHGLHNGILALPATLIRIAIDNRWEHILPHTSELISITHGKLLLDSKA